MKAWERERRLLEQLQEQGSLALTEACALTGASVATTRRDFELLQEKGLAQRTHGGLQLLGVLAVGPNHDVGVVAHCGDVVDAAQGHALGGQLLYNLLELGAGLVGVSLCRACAGACEHSVQGVVQGFAFFATAAVLVSCGVLAESTGSTMIASTPEAIKLCT